MHRLSSENKCMQILFSHVLRPKAIFCTLSCPFTKFLLLVKNLQCAVNQFGWISWLQFPKIAAIGGGKSTLSPDQFWQAAGCITDDR